MSDQHDPTLDAQAGGVGEDATTADNPLTAIPTRSDRTVSNLSTPAPVITNDDSVIAGGPVVTDTGAATAVADADPATGADSTADTDGDNAPLPAPADQSPWLVPAADSETPAPAQVTEASFLDPGTPSPADPGEGLEMDDIIGDEDGADTAEADAPAPDADLPQRTSLTQRIPAAEAQTAALGEVDSTLVRRQSLMRGDSAPLSGEGTAATAAGAGVAAAASATAFSDDFHNARAGLTTPAGGDASSDDRATAPFAPVPPAAKPAFLDGPTVEPSMPSRLGARIWSVLVTLLGVPVAWYLLGQYGLVRTFDFAQLSQTQLPHAGPQAGLAMLISGLVVTVIVIMTARWSSLGAFICGLGITAGAVYLAIMPDVALTFLSDRAMSAAGADNNLVRMLSTVYSTAYFSIVNGVFLLIGLALLALWFVSFRARRAGRQDAVTARKVAAAKAATN